MSDFRALDLSSSNPAFFALSTLDRPVDSDWLAVPNKAFRADLLEDVSAVYFALTGEELPAEDNTIIALYSDEGLKRIYGPAVYTTSEADGLLIRWGSQTITLSLKDGSFYAGEVELEFADAAVGRYTDLCLQGAVETADGSVLTFAFPVKKQEASQELTAKAVKLLLKKGFSNIASLFKQYGGTAEGGTSFSDEPIYATKSLAPGLYSIPSWKGVKGNTRYIYDVEQACLIGEALPREGITKFWAPAKLIQSIGAGLKQPAELEIVDIGDDKRKYNIIGEYDLSSSALNLSWM